MGMSRLSGMMIQKNEVECSPVGPFENKKFGGCIYMLKNGSRHTPIVSVDYGYYESAEDAVKQLNDLVEEVRALDLFPKEEK